MNTSKHTPGPWQVMNRTAGIAVEANSGTVVAAGVINCITYDDARLIAAAPDMLAALRRIITTMEADKTDGTVYYADMAAIARAALAKAGAP